MNEWVERSIEIANSPGYLDSLHEIYPIKLGARRRISAQVKQELKFIYDGQNELLLVKALFKVKKFPVEDPYVAFLRKRDFFLEYNPQTVARIAQRILSMSFEEMIDAIEEPKVVNRQMGKLFPEWLKTLNYPMLSVSEFRYYDGRIAFLIGGNGERKDYANKVLGCNLNKGPDLLVKVGAHYIIGEAKLLTDYGGHQNAQFADALRLLRGSEGDAIRIAILDGVV